MSASVREPSDVVNLALARIGYKKQIGSLYDGTLAARTALTIYAQTRDELLRSEDWGFAERNLPMTLLKQAPADGFYPPGQWSTDYPPLPWLYEYAYPTDCLKVRAVRPQPQFVMDFDPQPFVWTVQNDNSLAEPDKVILCNAADAILTYTGQLTNPIDWEANFTEAFAAALARRLAPALVGLDATKMAASDEQQAKSIADNVQG